MSHRKLTIVVTCTDRKAVAPAETLRASTLPAGTVGERAAEWRARLEAEPPVGRLLDLYKGETWTQAKRLAATAQRTGWEPDVFVASAGLGLRRVDDSAPSYAATFARRQSDSVATRNSDARAWWDLLPHGSEPALSRPAIWVLSETYASAMSPRLRSLDPETTVVIGGASNTPATVRVASNRNLRAALGGTVSSLNTRMAIRWLELADGKCVSSDAVRQAWADWAQDASQVERYDRRPVSDDTIRVLIRDMRAQRPRLSKTVALKELRASGIACEQRRFSGLFEEAFTA
ncbi:hypothetical protein CFI00_0160 [Nocardioides sp. S5]|uniref:hypothetical protein n=1 Tax=Nocardioides sp. S5 TaxID=2017486 RepID=UPI001A8F7247|nr:hypothetical protein [Nocardioides sp. S5]QSR33392.1 hypothetical protein CFI00_0160 [Nocardioides sp. S5]